MAEDMGLELEDGSELAIDVYVRVNAIVARLPAVITDNLRPPLIEIIDIYTKFIENKWIPASKVHADR